MRVHSLTLLNELSVHTEHTHACVVTLHVQPCFVGLHAHPRYPQQLKKNVQGDSGVKGNAGVRGNTGTARQNK